MQRNVLKINESMRVETTVRYFWTPGWTIGIVEYFARQVSWPRWIYFTDASNMRRSLMNEIEQEIGENLQNMSDKLFNFKKVSSNTLWAAQNTDNKCAEYTPPVSSGKCKSRFLVILTSLLQHIDPFLRYLLRSDIRVNSSHKKCFS